MDTTNKEKLMSEQETTAPTGISEQTLGLIQTVKAGMPSQQTDEFTRLGERLLNMQVCTSLSDEDATGRANVVPSGTTNGWHLSTDPNLAPVPCADRPETHRHLIFEA